MPPEPGWALFESLAQFLLPLWIGARGMEFSWEYIEMGIDSNVNLVGPAELSWPVAHCGSVFSAARARLRWRGLAASAHRSGQVGAARAARHRRRLRHAARAHEVCSNPQHRDCAATSHVVVACVLCALPSCVLCVCSYLELVAGLSSWNLLLIRGAIAAVCAFLSNALLNRYLAAKSARN